MPREREDLFRESNSLEKEKIIVLAFEGNDTEEIYFEEFKNSEIFNDALIFLHLLKRPKKDTNSAPNHVFKKLKKEAKDEYNFKDTDELWMIIDTDRWKNIPDIISECKKQSNMFVAVSNPCFEFWLLLHIKDIAEYNEEELDLMLKNGKVSSKKNYVDAKIVEILGAYNKSNPKPELFLPTVDFAIEQATQLDENNDEYPKKLGSHVYKVIMKLKKHG
ncbi:RloB family protein [Flectobacillus sp. DC10W]|uniref:RloB family protein n=1 Tax=Flectobacillus longus TaxID=2984207 RepID=A0ABT6YL74_9BACT|nr:RloB family protein [Flectobacillus longus]MDI9863908.1 RloB family protein [Flectobacillus longus]